MQVTIKKIYKGEATFKDRTGQEKTVAKVSIQTKEHGEGNWISTLSTKGTEVWKEGDTVEIEITEKEKDGKVYRNFNVPEPIDSRIEARLKRLEKEVFKNNFDKAIDTAYDTDFIEPTF